MKLRFAVRRKRSTGGDLGHAELTEALDFIPAVETKAEEAKHPPITAAAELAHAAAFGHYVVAQAPAIAERSEVGAADEAPAADRISMTRASARKRHAIETARRSSACRPFFRMIIRLLRLA